MSLVNDTFEAYCRRIGRTSAWGGQHEIIALCHVLRRNIEVFRHDMTTQCFPDPDTDRRAPYSGPPLRLSYHMHEYSGGEHYNSIVEAKDLGKSVRRRVPDESTVPAATAAALDSCDPAFSDSESSGSDEQSEAAHEARRRRKKSGPPKDDDEVWNPKAGGGSKKAGGGRSKHAARGQRDAHAASPHDAVAGTGPSKPLKQGEGDSQRCSVDGSSPPAGTTPSQGTGSLDEKEKMLASASVESAVDAPERPEGTASCYSSTKLQ